MIMKRMKRIPLAPPDVDRFYFGPCVKMFVLLGSLFFHYLLSSLRHLPSHKPGSAPSQLRLQTPELPSNGRLLCRRLRGSSTGSRLATALSVARIRTTRQLTRLA